MKKRIVIMSDSTCDLSEELIKKYDIKVFPLHIHMNDNQYLDGVNVKVEDIYKWSDETNKTPKTSALSPLEAENYITEALKEGEKVLCFTISQELSSTYNVMNLAVRSLEVEDKVCVIDSMNLSTGISMLILEAIEMINYGLTINEIVDRLNKLKYNVNVSFVIDTLTYLQRGGRCSSVASIAGNGLKIHPCVQVKEGKLGVKKLYRGKMSKVIKHYLEDLDKSLNIADKENIFITYSECDKELVDDVYQYLSHIGFKNIYITNAGSVISCHCGPGTLGVIFMANNSD